MYQVIELPPTLKDSVSSNWLGEVVPFLIVTPFLEFLLARNFTVSHITCCSAVFNWKHEPKNNVHDVNFLLRCKGKRKYVNVHKKLIEDNHIFEKSSPSTSKDGETIFVGKLEANTNYLCTMSSTSGTIQSPGSQQVKFTTLPGSKCELLLYKIIIPYNSSFCSTNPCPFLGSWSYIYCKSLSNRWTIWFHQVGHSMQYGLSEVNWSTRLIGYTLKVSWVPIEGTRWINHWDNRDKVKTWRQPMSISCYILICIFHLHIMSIDLGLINSSTLLIVQVYLWLVSVIYLLCTFGTQHWDTSPSVCNRCRGICNSTFCL